MPTPKEVFEQPDAFRNLITAATDSALEGQQFERKEACRPGPTGTCTKNQIDDLRDAIQQTVSAFANSNLGGGLMIIGVSKSGEILGVNHLTDQQQIGLLSLEHYVMNHAAEVREHGFLDVEGEERVVWLILVPSASHAICETREMPPKAWIRLGGQNMPMTETRREQIRRDKRIIDFERTSSCPFLLDDVDLDVLAEFRASFLSASGYELTDEQLLYHAGATVKDGSGYSFTQAGLLFFAANPQRIMPASYVRLLRFATDVEQFHDPGLPTFERSFSGPLTKQIRDLRAFFQRSGFFKTYQRRNPDGGFIDDPEYPLTAVDEAIVNAVAHRDYAVGLPIECFSYRDAFVVRNPGRILQRESDVRQRFSLSDTILDSMPRNPKLIEWLKSIRDQRGVAFVRALSEGTRVMRDEMNGLGLPAPEYFVGESNTIVTLYSLAAEREAALKSDTVETADEFTNLYPVKALSDSGPVEALKYLNEHRREFITALAAVLEAHGWFVDSEKYGRLVGHRQGFDLQVPERVRRIARFFPAYSFQLRQHWSKMFLCVDYSVEVKSVQTALLLLNVLAPDQLIGRRAIARQPQGWARGRVVNADRECTRVSL